MAWQPLEVKDFSGGITDNYVGGPINAYQKADNLIIFKHGERSTLFTRPGSTVEDLVNFQIPAGEQRIGALKNFKDTLFRQSEEKLYYIDGSYQTLQGPTGNDLFAASFTLDNFITTAEWNNHLLICGDNYGKPVKVYKDDMGDFQLRTAGMPALATSPTVTAGAVGTGDYIYRFVYAYTYISESLTFLDVGPITEVTLNNAAAPNANAVLVTNIPVLANGAGDNYDTTVVKVQIYRTIDDGTTFYFVGEVTNGTTTYNDNSSDATIQNNILLYTEGGVPDNDPPPLCKTMHVMEGRAYYGNIKSGTEINKNRVLQSQQNDPDSVPASFFADVDDDIVAISSARGSIVVICEKSAYRVDGSFDELGRGGMVVQRISDRCSCISGQSPVQTLYGVFWAGLDGFYFSDGYEVVKINRQWEKTYAGIVDLTSKPESRFRIQGKYDLKNNRVWWSVWDNASFDDVKRCYILHLDYGISEESKFTSASGGDSFSPTAIEFVGGYMYRADRRGYVFRHDTTLFSDPKIDVLSDPEDWDRQTIEYDYRSCATNFGTDFLRKFATRISAQCLNQTNLSLQIVSNNDDGALTQNLKPIRWHSNITWGDPDVYWGDPQLIWNKGGLLSGERHFPSKSLRCSYKQVFMQNAKVPILNSDLLGSMTVNMAAKTAVLDGSFELPDKLIDYFISFENDDYVEEYPILTRNSDTELSFFDGLGHTVNGSQKWVIRGKPIDDIMHLLSYTVTFDDFSRTEPKFLKSTSGEVGSFT